MQASSVAEAGEETKMNYTTTLADIQGRIELPLICNRRGLTGIAVEIGTMIGIYASDFLVRWQGKQFYTIDDYRGDPERSGDRKVQKLEAIERLAFFGRKCQMINSDSVAAAADFADGTVDFIHIDGDHSYEGCKRDMEAWWPKMKPGALFTGHDYCGHFDGLIAAVHEFAKKVNLPVQIVNEQCGHNTWMIEVPK